MIKPEELEDMRGWFSDDAAVDMGPITRKAGQRLVEAVAELHAQEDRRALEYLQRAFKIAWNNTADDDNPIELGIKELIAELKATEEEGPSDKTRLDALGKLIPHICCEVQYFIYVQKDEDGSWSITAGPPDDRVLGTGETLRAAVDMAMEKRDG